MDKQTSMQASSIQASINTMTNILSSEDPDATRITKELNSSTSEYLDGTVKNLVVSYLLKDDGSIRDDQQGTRHTILGWITHAETNNQGGCEFYLVDGNNNPAEGEVFYLDSMVRDIIGESGSLHLGADFDSPVGYR